MGEGLEYVSWIVAISGSAMFVIKTALMMIGALCVVASGLQETGGIEVIANRLLGRPKSIIGAQLRLMAPGAVMGGFMNNTTIVAMYLQIIGD